MAEHWPRVIVGAFLALAVAGCGEPESIRTYQVWKSPTEPPRVLAAIAPVGDKVWFFKLTGSVSAVEAQRDAFERFVQSLRFGESKDAPVSWTLPDGWRQTEGRNQLRFATLRAGPDALELSVTPLGQESGALLPNVNRWRGQIGLDPVRDESDLQPPSRQVTVAGRTITLLDMTGANRDPAGPTRRAMAMTPAAPAGHGGLKYTTPAGWTVQPVKGMRAASFGVRHGNDSAEVTVIPLGGPAGGLLANVNRWRKEIGLGEVDEKTLAGESKTLDLDGAKAVVVDLIGQNERTLGAIIEHGDRTWFVKLRGPNALVEKERANFEAFVGSLQLPSGGGS
jgi:hypothetical protein